MNPPARRIERGRKALSDGVGSTRTIQQLSDVTQVEVHGTAVITVETAPLEIGRAPYIRVRLGADSGLNMDPELARALGTELIEAAHACAAIEAYRVRGSPLPPRS